MIEFKLENGFKIDLEKSEKVFTPTGTTETIIEGILENNNEETDIKKLITNNENSSNENSTSQNTDFESLILEKIKNN